MRKDIDKFETSNNVFIKQNDNFFLEDEYSFDVLNLNTEPIKKINDYDFNLLKENAYKDISDDLFKLEYKISKYEEELKSINTQIQLAIEIQDYNLQNELYTRKQILEEDLEALLAIYNDKSLSAKITEKLTGLLGEKTKSSIFDLKRKLAGYSNVIISKLPKSFSSIIELKRALNKLENINRSVDELMTLNIPYGENIDKYEQLSKYIIKANSIQAEISKHVKR